MNREHSIMLILLIINILIVVAYLIPNLIEQEDKSKGYWIKAIVMLICPLIGPAFFFCAQLFYLLFYRQTADLSDVVFSKERVETHLFADEERGLNVVPLEEAIAVSDTGSLRLLVMNVVRGDIQNSLASISLALNSEDSETSHYAASVLQDELNKFRMQVQKIYIEIKRGGKEQVEYASMLIDYMDQVLVQHVFTEMEQMSYVKMMEEVCDILYAKEKESMTSRMFEQVCMRLLEVEEFKFCQKWCDRGMEEFPHTLSSYTCQLKLYFTRGQRERFFTVLDELKHSDLVIDRETLELIRVFG